MAEACHRGRTFCGPTWAAQTEFRDHIDDQDWSIPAIAYQGSLFENSFSVLTQLGGDALVQGRLRLPYPEVALLYASGPDNDFSNILVLRQDDGDSLNVSAYWQYGWGLWARDPAVVIIQKLKIGTEPELLAKPDPSRDINSFDPKVLAEDFMPYSFLIAGRALGAGLMMCDPEMRDTITEVEGRWAEENRRRSADGLPPINLRIGFDSGSVRHVINSHV